VIVWDALSGRQLSAIPTPQRVSLAIAFSSDGQRLVVGFVDGTLMVLDIGPDATQARELSAPTGHTGSIEAVTFSPDGKRFATASDDNTVKMWDAATGQEILTLLGRTGGVHGVAFSPDGTRLATAGGDGLVRVYLLRIEDLVALAKSRLTRTWTTAECQKYLHVEACPGD